MNMGRERWIHRIEGRGPCECQVVWGYFMPEEGEEQFRLSSFCVAVPGREGFGWPVAFDRGGEASAVAAILGESEAVALVEFLVFQGCCVGDWDHEWSQHKKSTEQPVCAFDSTDA